MIKAKNKRLSLEQLFKTVLEQSDPIPGDQVKRELMKRLARKEFMRFNPARFNIYYLAGIVAAGVTATLLLMSGAENEIDLPSSPGTGEIIINNAPLKVSDNYTGIPGKNIAEKPAAERNVQEAGLQSENIKDETPAENSKSLIVPEKTRNAIIPDSAIQKTLRIDNISDIGKKAELQMRTVAAFDVSAQSGCIPFKVSFRNNSQAFDSCRWIFGDGGFSNETDPVWIFDRAGEFRVTLIAFGKAGEEVSESRILNVYPSPEARFEFQPENPIIPDDAIRFINYSVDAVRYKWDFGDGRSSVAYEPEHKYDRFSNYNIRLIVWSNHGCSDSVTVLNALAGSGCYIDFPNAFIPNPDGPSGGYYTQKSDEGAQIFHPVTSGVSEFQLRIFSKIGILIFESNDINIGWDGYHNGQLCDPGVYIWKVRGVYKNGEPFVKMGDITLLKR